MADPGTGVRVGRWLLVLCLVATGPAVAGAQGGILSVDVSGDGVATRDGGTVYLWQGESYEVSVRFGDLPGQDDYIVCLDEYANQSGCSPKRQRNNVDEGEAVTVRFRLSASDRGKRQMRVRLHGDDFGPTNPKRDEVTVAVHVVRKRGDLDGDGVSNRDETGAGLNMTAEDTDGDGLLDGTEVKQRETDPARADTDGDGLSDGDEAMQYRTDPTRTDTDGDGYSDGREVREFGTNPLVADSHPRQTTAPPSPTDRQGSNGAADGPATATGLLTPTAGGSPPFEIDAVVFGVVGLLVGTVVAIVLMRRPRW